MSSDATAVSALCDPPGCTRDTHPKVLAHPGTHMTTTDCTVGLFN